MKLSAVFALAFFFSPLGLAMEKFHIKEGGQDNYFVRAEHVTAHLLLKNDPGSRLIVAFPEENSGIGIWLSSADIRLVSEESLGIYTEGSLRGIQFTVCLEGKDIEVKRILLNNIRILRDYGYREKCPQDEDVRQFLQYVSSCSDSEKERMAREGVCLDAVSEWLYPRTSAVTRGNRSGVEWRRRTLDGKNSYFLGIYPRGETVIADSAGDFPPKYCLRSPQSKLVLDIVAAVDFPPYTPVPAEKILKPEMEKLYRELAREDPLLFDRLQTMLRNLSFLSYEEKVVAGSWRFLTYFGRDSMMSLLMLHSVVRPEFYANIILSVLKCTNANGEVAHEEDIGDQAMVRRLIRFTQLYRSQGFDAAISAVKDFSAPIYDYKMIDDDFMLPIMVAEYLMDSEVKPEDSAGFLRKTCAGSQTALEKIVANLDYVLAETRAVQWVGLKERELAGDWRDSAKGLGYGRYPFSVNGALIPVCLRACGEIVRLLPQPELRDTARNKNLKAVLEILDSPQKLQQRWELWEEARKKYEISHSREQSRGLLRKYGSFSGQALPLPESSSVKFYGLALDQEQNPLPIMHTDGAFLFLQSFYVPKDLSTLLGAFEEPYPKGLWTDVGPVVANPAYSGQDSFYEMFDRHQYHGAVVWSWHISLLELGLIEQLRSLYPMWVREQKPEDLDLLRRIKSLLGHLFLMEGRIASIRASELWSWELKDGRFEYLAFGMGKDVTESNALQLWSCVVLAAWLEYRSIQPLLEKIPE